MVSDYINLKVHTQFSICEGAVKISKLSTFCKENNISAVGICDKSNLSGALEVSQELIKQGVQPIIGTSIFLKEKPFVRPILDLEAVIRLLSRLSPNGSRGVGLKGLNRQLFFRIRFESIRLCCDDLGLMGYRRIGFRWVE